MLGGRLYSTFVPLSDRKEIGMKRWFLRQDCVVKGFLMAVAVVIVFTGIFAALKATDPVGKIVLVCALLFC
jgi:hypothetical protein